MATASSQSGRVLDPDRADGRFERVAAVVGGQPEPQSRAVHAPRERAELGRDLIERAVGRRREPAGAAQPRELAAEPGEREPDRFDARRLLGRQRVGELGELLDDAAHGVAVVGIGRGPRRLVKLRVRAERGLDLGHHRRLAHDREILVEKHRCPRHQEVGELGVAVAE